MEDKNEKVPVIRNIVYIVAFILLFEIFMLIVQVPQKTTFLWVTISALGLMCAYLVILCLKLIRELDKKGDKE